MNEAYNNQRERGRSASRVVKFNEREDVRRVPDRNPAAPPSISSTAMDAAELASPRLTSRIKTGFPVEVSIVSQFPRAFALRTESHESRRDPQETPLKEIDKVS